ncbi:MAG: hypothetical protein OXN81_18745 [Alphaproteobacteria bacterium]|nr:hypothetical protein [Alphaproteobacteria bacterium]
MTIDFEELDELREDWAAIFHEPMPWGFGIGEEETPLLRRCVEERSREPLDRYVRALLSDGRIY